MYLFRRKDSEMTRFTWFRAGAVAPSAAWGREAADRLGADTSGPIERAYCDGVICRPRRSGTPGGGSHSSGGPPMTAPSSNTPA